MLIQNGKLTIEHVINYEVIQTEVLGKGDVLGQWVRAVHQSLRQKQGRKADASGEIRTRSSVA